MIPERRAIGFTVEPMVCIDPKVKPIIGLVRVGMIRSKEPLCGKAADRMGWYEYGAVDDFPTTACIQDSDHHLGCGASLGEVQSTVRKAFGSIGCVTNGSFCNLDIWAPGYQMIGGGVEPSHAHVQMVEFGKQANIFGMQVDHDEMVHVDFHGAVVIPREAVKKLPAAIDLLTRREKVILDIWWGPEFSRGRLHDAIRRSGEIH